MIAFRANFVYGVFSNLLWACAHIVIIFLLTAKTSSVYGWSRSDLIILVASSNLLLGVFYFLFSRSLHDFSETINLGKLDSILSKPVDSQFLLSLSYASYYSLSRVILGVAVISIVIVQSHMQITIMNVLGFVLLLSFGLVLQYAIWFGLITLTIWFTTLSNLVDLLYESNDIPRFPQEMYKGGREIIFLLVFPFTLILTVPVRALLTRVSIWDVVGLLAFSSILFLLSRKFFKFALRSYTSASG